MGIYTAYDLAEVDSAIETHMHILKGLCMAHLGANLESLVLSGSFGRGEGSVILHPGGAIEPLRDYDARVILRRPIDPGVIETIRAEFMRVTGLGDTHEQFSGQQGFSLTLEPLTSEQLAAAFVRDRDLRAYDHLHASRLITGADHAPALRFPASEIPSVNGLRLLYKKMVGLVGHYAGPDGAGDMRRTLLYECDKTFVEICTALVLLAGAYVPSYRERARLFGQRWRDWFPDLEQRLPHLDTQIQRATQEKLYPGSTAPIHPQAAFAQARAALLAVHRFYTRQLYGLDVTPGYLGCRLLRRALRHDYYRVPVARWLGQRRLNLRPARWALNRAYQCQLRLRFAYGAGLRGRDAWWAALHLAEGPPLDIFLAAWCTLAACEEPPDAALLSCAGQTLARLPGMAVPGAGPSSGWKYYLATRERIIRAFTIWEHNR